MTPEQVKSLAQRLLSGGVALDDFVTALAAPRSAELGEVTLDLDRRRRCGFPEVVYGEGKTVATLEKTLHRLLAEGQPVLATRVSSDVAAALAHPFPTANYNALARTFRIAVAGIEPAAKLGRVAVVTAGTTDLPVAEEARETLDWMGVATVSVNDVGVAGPHRLLAQLDKLHAADAVVVVAGMEGALPSVVGGHVDCPVIAVPTSVGYGASLGGLTAMFTMLTSCAANVCVVNIDAGFKGGYVAGMIARRAHKTVV